MSAAHALERLPRLAEALERGLLGIDKVVELARFARPDDEERLVRWAARVSVGAVRHRGDVLARATREQATQVERERFLSWGYVDGGRRLALQAELPAAAGAVVAQALDRLAATIPVMPGEGSSAFVAARRADALVALCSRRAADDPDPDRGTVVIHAQWNGLAAGTGGCEMQDGPAVHPLTVQRMLCNARVQSVLEDGSGNVIRLGRMRREPSAWMLRQVRYRDRGCRFPGCGARAFTEAHHIRWWRHGGRTDLDNLVLICSFHHRLVHEHGWSLGRDREGEIRWFHPGGSRYRAGPSPGVEPQTRQEPTASLVGG